MATILHVDMDSFFASCEQQANPRLRGKPIAVSGDPKSRTVVAAASKEAKRFGVKSAMTIHDARRLCPQIEFVLGNPDRYVTVSRQVIAILESYTPDVEVTSIDEAFMDVTGWAERAGGVLRMAHAIKRQVRLAFGEWITCSIGIASNKRLAKLASDFDKPDGIVVVTDDRFPCHPEGARATEGSYAPEYRVRVLSRADLLSRITLRDLCGIGSRIEARLAAMGITTVAGLATTPVSQLVQEFGVYGNDLHDMAVGEDDRLVRTGNDEPKSMSHACTLPRDIHTYVETHPVVEELSEKVAARLRRHGYEGSTVHLQLRFADFSGHVEQRTLATATDDGLRIAQEAMRMLIGRALSKPIRLVGIGVSALRLARPTQLPLFPRDQRWWRAIRALDRVNDRYGDWTLQRGALLRSERYARKVAAAFQSTQHLRAP